MRLLIDVSVARSGEISDLVGDVIETLRTKLNKDVSIGSGPQLPPFLVEIKDGDENDVAKLLELGYEVTIP